MREFKKLLKIGNLEKNFDFFFKNYKSMDLKTLKINHPHQVQASCGSWRFTLMDRQPVDPVGIRSSVLLLDESTNDWLSLKLILFE